MSYKHEFDLDAMPNGKPVQLIQYGRSMLIFSDLYHVYGKNVL